MNTRNAKMMMAIAGAALIAGFFMPWVANVSGWQFVKSPHVSYLTRMILALCPLGGVALLVSALNGARRAGSIAVGMGLGVLGYIGYRIVDTFLAVTGIGLWIVIAAAVISLFVGLLARPSSTPAAKL